MNNLQTNNIKFRTQIKHTLKEINLIYLSVSVALVYNKNNNNNKYLYSAFLYPGMCS